MKLIDRIDRKPVAVAFGMRKTGGGTASGELSLSVTLNAESVSLLTQTGAVQLPAATPSVAGVLGATDKKKLEGIEAGATADQTAPEMVAAIDTHLGSISWREGGSGGGATNLSVTRDAGSVTVASDTGADAVLPKASAADAGVMAAADKAKLDGIEAGAQVNPGAAAIKAAYESNADTNAFTDAERAKLGGIEQGATGDQTGPEIVAAIDAALGGAAWKSGGAGGTNLSFARNTSSLTVLSDTGSDAVLPSATVTEAGVMSAADKAKLDGLGSGGQGAGDMAAAIYDPRGVSGDAFDRAKHTGVQSIGTVTGLQTALDGKAASAHSHAIGDTNGLQAALDAKPAKTGTPADDMVALWSNANTIEGQPGFQYSTSGNRVTIGASGKLAFGAVDILSDNGGTTTLANIDALDATTEATIEAAIDTLPNLALDAAQLTGNVSVNRFNGGTGASSSTFLRGDGTWGTPAGGSGGSGDVTKVGTPAANRMAYWTGDGMLGHEAGFTYDPSTDTLTVAKIVIGGVTFDGQNQLADPGADRLMGWHDSAGMTAFFAAANGLEISGTSLQMTANQRTTAVEFVIDGGGSAITPGTKGFIQVPFACTITAARLLADRSGSLAVDVWKDTFANYPPTAADSITASAKPTISSAAKSENTTLTGWSTSVAAGDILAFNVDSASTITRATVVLVVTVS